MKPASGTCPLPLGGGSHGHSCGARWDAGPCAGPGGGCWGSGMRPRGPSARTWGGELVRGGHRRGLRATWTSGTQAQGGLRGAQRPPSARPRCPSSGKEAAPGIEPAVSHRSACRALAAGIWLRGERAGCPPCSLCPPRGSCPPAAGSGSGELGPECVDGRRVRGSHTQTQATAPSPRGGLPSRAQRMLPLLPLPSPPPSPPGHLLSFPANSSARAAILLRGFAWLISTFPFLH